MIKVLIVKCSIPEWWHEAHICSEVSIIEEFCSSAYLVEAEEQGDVFRAVLPKKDSIVID